MPAPKPDPVQPPDAEALRLAHDMLADCRHAALAYTDPAHGTPGISRIAFGMGPDGAPMTLISSLAPHFAALNAHSACALMLGEPGDKGDPLTHPRLMIRVAARFVSAQERLACREKWLADHPKTKLYIDFADFAFVQFTPTSALLNGGFGRAHSFTAADLQIPKTL